MGTISLAGFMIMIMIIAGYCLVQGMILSYIIEKGQGSSASFLFPGLFAAVLAIFSLAWASLYSRDNDDKSTLKVSETLNPMAIESSSKEHEDPLYTDIQLPNIVANLARRLRKEMNNWFYVCLVAGGVASLWSPLSTIGE